MKAHSFYTTLKQKIVIKSPVVFFFFLCLYSCSKKPVEPPVPPAPPPAGFDLAAWAIDHYVSLSSQVNVKTTPLIKLTFGAPVDRSGVMDHISLKEKNGSAVPYLPAYEKGDSTVVIQPSAPLRFLTRYSLSVSAGLKSAKGGKLLTGTDIQFLTSLDSSQKFPTITDDSLLTLVQRQTFGYFWEFAHPVSGLARERNTSGDLVTSGGSGFGIMAIITAVHRGFITRAEGLARLQKITGFLKTKAQRFHGAFPHWLNGSTGTVIPFSTKDNGADLVETSYLVMGLLCARQYFTGADEAETGLRNDITAIWDEVEWSWFRKNNEKVLYWHWSPAYGWEMNHPIRGWNEALITYVLAASSNRYPIPKEVYEEGWAGKGAMKNNAVYFGYRLPLGPPYGGPLFFSHYSFLGMDPRGLVDQYADYHLQVVNHSKINYEYSRLNPLGYYGYSHLNWGLTASDVPGGYTASSPTNDVGVIAPTAALSSLPFTPAESTQALKFFYYTLGDKVWRPYGFVDAFSLQVPWVADSYLAIDQGPIIVMIENYRSGLLWSLFTSSPEVKRGMRSLGFSAPYL